MITRISADIATRASAISGRRPEMDSAIMVAVNKRLADEPVRRLR